mmetsp:Transcript_12965/g.33185  ORF Transcript_12965/g.33185 Transcript_12965/m.33185 type:complete len:138 (+) Transcript_12965:924-1337(+)
MVEGTCAVLIQLFPELIGADRATQAKVQQWCMDAVSPKYAEAEAERLAVRKQALTREIVRVLNETLAQSAYLAGNNLTIADLAVCAAVSGLFPLLHQAERESVAHVTRWIKHVQASPGFTSVPVIVAANCVMPLGAH